MVTSKLLSNRNCNVYPPFKVIPKAFKMFVSHQEKSNSSWVAVPTTPSKYGMLITSLRNKAKLPQLKWQLWPIKSALMLWKFPLMISLSLLAQMTGQLNYGTPQVWLQKEPYLVTKKVCGTYNSHQSTSFYVPQVVTKIWKFGISVFSNVLQLFKAIRARS